MSPEAKRADAAITKVVVVGVVNHVLEVGTQVPDMVTMHGYPKWVTKITDSGGDRPELRVEYRDGTVDVLRNVPVIIRSEAFMQKCAACGAAVSKEIAQSVEGQRGLVCMDCALRLRREARQTVAVGPAQEE